MKSQEGDTHYEVTLGPIKIKDGLFMGDELSAKDIEFIISNKVTHIVNTVVQSIPNLWEKFGVHYLSVGWTEKQTKVFDNSNEAVETIFNFIEEATEKGESCLVHSINGKSRTSVVIVAYLIRKYRWSLAKCLQYLDSRKERLQIRINYLRQLEDLQTRFKWQSSLNDSWNKHTTKEQLIINNTFKNSITSHEEYYEVPEFYLSHTVKKIKPNRRVSWGQSEKVLESSEENKTVKNGAPMIKSILKENHSEIQCETLFKRKNQNREQESSKRNISDSLDNLLFEEDTKRNIYEKSHSEKAKEEDNRQDDDLHQPHYFRPFQHKISRKTTINHGKRPKSLDTNNFETESDGNEKQIDNKRSKHYEQVMASYKSPKFHLESEANLRLKSSTDDLGSLKNISSKKKLKPKGSTISNPSKIRQNSKGNQKTNSPFKVKKSFKSKIKIQITTTKNQ